MSINNPDMDLFARVVNGEIVEYPVRRLHIHNRAHPMAWYRPVKENEKPELPPFHYYTHTLSLEGQQVVVTYRAVPYTLAELLRKLKPTADLVGGEEPAPISIAEVDLDLIARVHDLAGDYVTEKISNFAKSRKYGNEKVDSFVSLSTYRTSTIEKFRLEAERVFQIRDQAWANLLAYMDRVLSGQDPVPTSIEAIDILIPPLIWPDQDPEPAQG